MDNGKSNPFDKAKGSLLLILSQFVHCILSDGTMMLIITTVFTTENSLSFHNNKLGLVEHWKIESNL